MISRETLEGMFENIRATIKWQIDGPMLWGYFFTDQSAEKLRSIAPLLEVQGYRLVEIFQPKQDAAEQPYFFLHVEKEEAHSVQSLHERNQQLYAFAELHALGSYDGMDVGPIDVGASVQ